MAASKLKTKIKIETLEEQSSLIIGLIEKYVMQDKSYGTELSDAVQFICDIDYKRPGKPEDLSVGYIAYDTAPDTPRMKLRTSRYLTRKCKLHSILNDKEIRELADTINSYLWTNEELNKIELVSGSKITKAYRDCIGGRSCMTGNCADYTLLYEMNPERFQMIIAYNNADTARAIVHKLDNGHYFMDRIYTTAEHLKDVLKDYADSHGWGHKIKMPDLKTLVVSGLEYEDGHIPYMDTMTCGCTCGKGLTISYVGCCDYELQSQHGELETHYVCENCGEAVSEESVFWQGTDCFCEYCFGELFVACENCGETVSVDATYCIADKQIIVCEYCARYSYHCCSHCRYLFSDEACYGVENDVLCDGCYETFARNCNGCNEDFYLDSLTKIDGYYYCSDCKADAEAELREKQEQEQEQKQE